MIKKHPYRFRLWWRKRLPWFLIDLGVADKGNDCELVNAEHHWYNIDNERSGCYYCKKSADGKNGSGIKTTHNNGYNSASLNY